MSPKTSPAETKEVVQENLFPEVSSTATTFEANISIIPVFATTRRGLSDTHKYHFVGEISIGGVKADVELLISTDPTYGKYPSNFDRKVARAIDKLLWNHLQRNADFSNPLAFSSRELCREMRIADRGPNVQAVVKSINKLLSTTVRGSLYIEEAKQFLHDTYHIYTRFVSTGAQRPDGSVADRNYLWVADWYLKNFKQGNVIPVDYEYYLTLRSPLAQRLYELIRKEFFGLFRQWEAADQENRPRQEYIVYNYEKEYCVFVVDRPERYLSKAKENTRTAHQELVDSGYLARMPEWVVQDDDWLIHYCPGERAIEEYARFSSSWTTGSWLEGYPRPRLRPEDGRQLSLLPEEDPAERVVQQLQERGLKDAQQLVEQSEHAGKVEVIEQAILDFDGKVENGYKFNRTPQAWLRWAISGKKSRGGAPYQPPEPLRQEKEDDTQQKKTVTEPVAQNVKKAPRKRVKKEYEKLWDEVLEVVQGKVRKTSFEHWFKTARLVEIEKEGTAVVECGVEKGSTWMEEHYQKLVLEVFGELREDVVGVRFTE